MLSADVAGFSKLTDAQLPVFADQVLGRLSQAFGAFSKGIESINTWGDGIFAVFNDAGIAAECALAVQDCMSRIDFWSLDLPSTMALRIGGHLGPVYCRHDPIVMRPNYYGAHVSRAARIEPIVPRNCVYVTEPFAAVLCLRENHRFACDYVGLTELYREYGRLRMFLLRRADVRAEPAAVTDITGHPAAQAS